MLENVIAINELTHRFCTLQKRNCYFDNCISHQNCNSLHGCMGRY